MAPYQPGQCGKSFTVESADHICSLSHIFNSSVPQRASVTKPSIGGRVLGPQTYQPPQPRWVYEPRRMGSSFCSKSAKGIVNDRTITSDVDFLNKPELYATVRECAPGSKTLPWMRVDPARPRTHPASNTPNTPYVAVDVMYDANFPPKQTLATGVVESSRKYASSFTSAERRFKEATQNTTLGPGQYEMATSTVQIIDPKRASSAFKTVAPPSIAKAPSEAPDMIHNPLLAQQAKTWTSKGFAFSTRERFPRVRARWQD